MSTRCAVPAARSASARKTLSRRDFARSSAICRCSVGDRLEPRLGHLRQRERRNPLTKHRRQSIIWALRATHSATSTGAQMINFMKQLNVLALNAKDVKDHLPTDPQQEAAALADYTAAGIKLHAAGTIYFPQRRRCRHALEQVRLLRSEQALSVIVAGDPAPRNSAAHREIRSGNTTSASPSTITDRKIKSGIPRWTY